MPLVWTQQRSVPNCPCLCQLFSALSGLSSWGWSCRDLPGQVPLPCFSGSVDL